jgi:hypothetical protein
MVAELTITNQNGVPSWEEYTVNAKETEDVTRLNRCSWSCNL